MPTFLEQLTNTEIKVRFKEPFLTAGLNEKMTGIIPQGIYRGFKLTTNASAMTVTVEADANEGDHLAVYTPADGYSLTLRRTTGDFSIDLTALASKTVVLALYADYETATDTSAIIRAYELSPSDEYTIASELAELVTLGTVVVPASGVIPAANITPDYRKAAWTQLAPESREGVQLVENGGFEFGMDTTFPIAQGEVTISGWDTVNDFQDFGVFGSIDLLDSHSGFKSLALSLLGFAGQYYFVPQFRVFPVTPGSVITMEAWVKQEGSTGDLPTDNILSLTFYDYDLVYDDWFPLTQVAIGNIGWTKFSRTVTVPSTSYYVQVAVDIYDAAGTADGLLHIDDASVWMERQVVGEDAADTRVDIRSDVNAGMLSMLPPHVSGFDTYFERILRLVHEGVSGGLDQLSLRSSLADRDFILNLVKGAIDVARNVQGLGSDILLESEAATIPRIETPVRSTSGDYTFLWEMGTPDELIRIYAAPDTSASVKSNLVITVNAEWYDSGGGAYKWRRDVAGAALREDWGPYSKLTYAFLESAASPWDDADWNDGTNGYRISRAATDSTYGSIFTIDRLADLVRETRLGNSLLGTAADAAISRLKMPIPAPATGRYVPLFEGDSASGSTQQKPRIYITRQDDSIAEGTSGPRLVFTYNAYWNGTSWTSDDSSETSTRMDFAAGKSGTPENVEGVYFFSRPISGTNWTDSAWRNDHISAGRYTERLLCAENVVKSWGQVFCAATTPTLRQGFNVSSPLSYSGSGGPVLNIPFVAAFDSSNDMCAVATTDDVGTAAPSVVNTSATQLDIEAYDDTGAQITLNGSLLVVTFIVMGRN